MVREIFFQMAVYYVNKCIYIAQIIEI